MSSNECRLRKYLRKKRRAKNSEKFDRLACLYWRYHHKVYGPIQNIWALGE